MSRSGVRGTDQVVEFGEALGMQRGERQVFELLLQLLHAEAVGQRRVDVEGLLGDPLLLLERHRGERAHVVQPVGELDDEDPQVLGHRHQHLAHRGGLLLLRESKRIRSSLVTPSTIAATSGPKSRSTSPTVISVSSTASCRRAAVTEISSRPMSATIWATASGWLM